MGAAPPETENTADPETAPGDTASRGLKARLAPYRDLVEAEMRRHMPDFPDGVHAESLDDWLARDAPKTAPGYAVYSAVRHTIESGGKRIRPILTLLAAEAVSGDPERALPTAAGLELLHTFTLVHDDVMDNDLTRRGRPTVHALWGGPLAITAGDGLYALAFIALADNAQVEGTDPADVVALSQQAAQVSFDICNGQAQDLLFEESDRVDLAAYEEMIRLKTGVLLSFSCEAGARVAGGDDKAVAAIRTYGDHLGLAFQVKDDLLDLLGSEKEIGKPVGSDIRAGKKTHPALHALEHAEAEDRDRLHAILATDEKETTATMVAEAIRIMDRAGSLDAAARHAEAHIAKAKAALDTLQARSPDAVDLLHRIADYILTRRD